MSELFGLPTVLLARSATLVLACVLMALAVLAWRRPLLVQLGLRAAPRRRLRTALIVLGLTTSTAVITTAIGTGETMALTVRALVAGGVGPVDEVITTSVRGAGASLGIGDPGALLSGGDLAAGEFFPLTRTEALQQSFANDPDVAALVPALQLQATAISRQTERARTGVNVIGLPPGAPRFDRFSLRSGEPLKLSALQDGEVLVNAEAGRLLGLAAGVPLTLRLPGGAEAVLVVRAVVRDGGLTGTQPAAVMPLAALQRLARREEQVNQVLVANRSGGDEAGRSRAVTGRLRLALADPALMTEVAHGLATEAGQSQLRALEARVRADVRPAVRRLREVSRSGVPSAELAYFVADPLLTTEYRWIINAAANQPALRGRPDAAQRLAPLTVLEVKQRALQAANEYGSAVTAVFMVLGLFSIAAALLLVFLIFVMLAAERRTEMGLTRAVGAHRHHLVAAFAIEGMVYDLAAALAGLLLGLGTGALVLRLLQRALERWDVVLQGHISAGGLLLAFCLGALVTFATVLLAAWRVSNVNIIAAIHGVSAPPPIRRRRRVLLAATVQRAGQVAVLMVGGGGLAVLAPHGGVMRAAGGALMVLAAAQAARLALPRARVPVRHVNRLVATVAGALIALLFALSPDAPASVRGDDALRSGTAGFVLAGVAMAVALVWAAGANLDALLAPLRWLARPFGSLAPATRIAVAYPLTHPFRTGLTAAMFALVFLTMVTATALLRSTEAAYVRRDGGAGFDIRIAFGRPPEDVEQAIASSDAVRRDDFAVIGAQASSAVEALWPGADIVVWRPVELRVADAGLLSGSSGELAGRAQGLDSDRAVWQALNESSGLAVLARRDIDMVPGLRTAIARGGRSATFTPAPVWLRDPRGGVARRVTVIGVTADGSILSRGLLTGQASVEGMPAATQPPAEYFLRTAEGVSLRTAATGIELTFPGRGIRTRILGEEARTGHEIRRLLDALIRGFLGMGLLSGIAALGVIGMRSVAERRQQIGMLRALGFSRRSIRTSFLLEGCVVATLGIGAGAVSGLVLAQNIVNFLARDFTQLRLLIPWWQIASIGAAAYCAALMSALAVAWQAGRVTPAEALRYE